MARTMTQYKWFWVWDFDKEEKWLNQMAESGWALKSVGFCRYTFEACEPGEYIVRLEMHGVNSSDSSYVSFMEETGAEYIGRVFQWMYFRRKSELGPFDIFSDIDSKRDHLRRINKMTLIAGLTNLVVGFLNSMNGSRLSWINLVLASVLMYASGRMKGRIDALDSERLLRE